MEIFTYLYNFLVNYYAQILSVATGITGTFLFIQSYFNIKKLKADLLKVNLELETHRQKLAADLEKVRLDIELGKLKLEEEEWKQIERKKLIRIATDDEIKTHAKVNTTMQSSFKNISYIAVLYEKVRSRSKYRFIFGIGSLILLIITIFIPSNVIFMLALIFGVTAFYFLFTVRQQKLEIKKWHKHRQLEMVERGIRNITIFCD